MNRSSISDSSIAVLTYRNIEAVPPDVIQLFDAAEDHYPEFSAGWFANLQQTVFGDDSGVRYHVAFRAGEPQAILPVRSSRSGLVRRLEALGNYYTSLYSPILGPQSTLEDLAGLLQTASRSNGRLDEMRFAPMDPESTAYIRLQAALREIGWVPFEYYCFDNWYLKVSGGYGDYLKSRTSSLRSTIKRMNRRFAEHGGKIEIVTTPERVVQGIQDYAHVYGRSWKKPEPYPEFVPGMMRLMACKGSLRLGIARVSDQPIAAQLWIASNGKALIFKVAYDEQFSEYSPGTLLASHLMEYVIDCDKVTEVDFLMGGDAYKKDWMSNQRQRMGIVAFNPRTFVGNGLMAKQAIGRALHKARILK